jgi:hypothetical protein
MRGGKWQIETKAVSPLRSATALQNQAAAFAGHTISKRHFIKTRFDEIRFDVRDGLPLALVNPQRSN